MDARLEVLDAVPVDEQRGFVDGKSYHRLATKMFWIVLGKEEHSKRQYWARKGRLGQTDGKHARWMDGIRWMDANHRRGCVARLSQHPLCQ